MRRRAGRGSVLVAVCAALVAACGGADDSGSSSTAQAATPAAATPAVRDAIGVYGRRYCELFLVESEQAPITIQVWNTYGLNDCPAAQWNALDLTAVAHQQGVPLALRNGPRFWAMDSITQLESPSMRTAAIGGLEMQLDARIDIGSFSGLSYASYQVDRRTVFVYGEGRRVAELRGPDGTTYVMQSWSQEVDPTMSDAELPGLGRHLLPPTGWTYSTRVLSAPLTVDTTKGRATVVQDTFADTYAKEG